SCEDQDLAERAKDLGVGFLHDTRIDCLHNDQIGDLDRCRRQQYWFAHDGARFCAKYPAVHGRSSLAEANGALSRHDRSGIAAKKIAKTVLATKPLDR